MKIKGASLSHILAGFVMGDVLWFLYLTAIQMQFNFGPNNYGYTMVWGRRVHDVISWGELFPLVFAIGGLVLSWFFPILLLRSQRVIRTLLVFFVFLSGAIVFRMSQIPTAVW